MQLRLLAERSLRIGASLGMVSPAPLLAAVKEPMTAATGRQALIIKAAAAGVWRRDPTSPALARPPDAGAVGADGVPRDWLRGTRSTYTVRLQAPLASSRKRSLTEPSPCPYPTTTEFYRDLGLLPGQLGEPTLKFGTDLGGLTGYRSDARRQSHQPVKVPEISGA